MEEQKQNTNVLGLRSRIASAGKHAGALVSVGLHTLLGSRAENAFGILMYHRVTDVTPGVPEPTWNVTPAQFRAQLYGLRRRGYQFWSLRRVIEHSREGLAIPAKTAVVTLDDGYQNAFLHAWPALKELNIPATIFVATSFVGSDHPLPFDAWGARYSSQTAPGAWKALTWAECVEMDRSGLMEIGTHSHTHADFRGRDDVLESDVRTSIAILRERLGRDDYTFSFPYGGRRLGYAGDALMEAARRAGVLCGLTTETELATPGSSPFGWGRFEVVQSDSAATLAAKLEGWYSWMGQARAMFRVLSPPGRSGSKTNAGKMAW